MRLVLVPAVMELLGKANWWLPGWLDRLRPARRPEVSGAALSADEPPALTSAVVRANADFRTGISAPGSGEFEVELASAPPGDGGVGGQVGFAEDG